jgi:hypothetical protein
MVVLGFQELQKLELFNNVLCSLQYNATNFESSIKDDVIVHFHTWANMFDSGLQGRPPPSPIHYPKP